MDVGDVSGSVWFIDNDLQQQVLTPGDAVAAMEAAYREWAAGRAAIRPKTNLYVYNSEGGTRYSFSSMEGGACGLGLVAIRIKSDLQPLRRWAGAGPGSGAEAGAPPTAAHKSAGRTGLFCGLVYLFDARSGLPLAICNDGWLQHVRVGATAGLAARHLARPDAATLGLLGSQWMARTHALAICAVRRIERVRVYSPNRAHREAFAREMEPRLGLPVTVCDGPEAAVRGADVVACCTNSVVDPVLWGDWIEPGAFVSNVLSSEIHPTAKARFAYTVKNQPLRPLGAAIAEAGAPPADAPQTYEGTRWPALAGEDSPLLADVVAGTAPGRADPGQIIFFCNNEGTGLQFAAVGRLLLDRVRQSGLQPREIPLAWFLQDIPD